MSEKKATRNIIGLQEVLWEQIDSLQRKDPEMNLDRASLVIKAVDSLIGTVKLQLAHASLLKQSTALPFMAEEQKAIDHKE